MSESDERPLGLRKPSVRKEPPINGRFMTSQTERIEACRFSVQGAYSAEHVRGRGLRWSEEHPDVTPATSEGGGAPPAARGTDASISAERPSKVFLRIVWD